MTFDKFKLNPCISIFILIYVDLNYSTTPHQQPYAKLSSFFQIFNKVWSSHLELSFFAMLEWNTGALDQRQLEENPSSAVQLKTYSHVYNKKPKLFSFLSNFAPLAF